MMPKSLFDMVRALLVVGAVAALVASVTAHGAWAQSNPVAFAQKLGDDAIRDLTDPGLSDTERVKHMRRLLDNAFDAKAVSKFVLGPYARRATDEQFQAFVRLYKIYVAHNYAGLFKRYNGEKAEMLNARKLADDNQIVSGVIRQPDGPSIGLELRLRPMDSSFKVVDLKVEGVSMPLVHRKQFASVIMQRGGKVQGLIDALRDAIEKFEKETPSE